MPTPNEKKALGFFVLLAISGSGVRVWRARSPDPPAATTAALERQLERIDSAGSTPRRRARATGRAKAEPASPAVPVDLDRATAAEMEALPGIGPALAARILAHRDSAGSFGSMDALCQVRGIGKSLAGRLRPLVTFSAPRRPVSAACGEGSKSSRRARLPRGREER